MNGLTWDQIRRAARLDEHGEDEIELLWIAVRILVERIKKLENATDTQDNEPAKRAD